MRATLLCVCFFTAALPAFAQGRANTFLLEETTILPTSAGQYEPAQRGFCAALVPASAPVCLVFSTAVFGDPGRYLTLVPFTNFSHFDQGQYAKSGLTIEEAHSLNTVPAVASTHTSVIAMDRELSFTHTTNPARPLNLFLEYRLRTGSMDAFTAAIRSTLLPAARKSAVPAFEVFHTLVGASTERVFVVYRLDSFADLNSQHPFVGEGSGWQDFLTKYVLSSDSYVLRYRSDISVDPTDPNQ